MKLKPLGDRLIVKPVEEEETTASGIVLPDTAKDAPLTPPSGLPASVLLDGKGCMLGAMNAPAAWDSDDAKALIKAAIGEEG